jgi:DNA-directed RNA polymerase specialized sigma24 family protein
MTAAERMKELGKEELLERLENLPEKQKFLVALRCVENMTFQEIANVSGKSVEKVEQEFEAAVLKMLA